MNETFFVIGAITAIVGALGTVLAKNALRAAVGLLVTIISLAGLYVLLYAHLLAVLQLLVYAGAVVVLFVFVIMLIGPSANVPHDQRGLLWRTLGLAVMGILTIGLAFTLLGVAPPAPVIAVCEPGTVDCPPDFGGVAAVGEAMYRQAAVPFELVSILLLVAIVGAVAVARGRSIEELTAAKQKRLAQQAELDAQAEKERQLAAEVSAHGGHG